MALGGTSANNILTAQPSHHVGISDSELSPASSAHTLYLSKHNSNTENSGRIHSAFVRDLIASLVEALGTFLFLFAAYGTVNGLNVAAGGDSNEGIARVLVTATAFGLSLLVVAWALYRVSGGVLNPAVTVALAMVGAIQWRRAAMFIIAHLIGAVCAGALAQGLFPGPFTGANVRKNGITNAQAFFLELLLTALFTFVILMLAVEKSKQTYLAPVGIGLALFLVHLVAVPFTGCSVNPARSFGASIFEGEWRDHWIFWVGPVAGAVLAAVFYMGMKKIDYETLNPGQDAEHPMEKDRAMHQGRGQEPSS